MSNTTKKKTTYRLYLKLYGQPVVVDEICTKESALLRLFYEGEYHGVMSLRIRSSILEKALDYCKKRAEMKIQHKDEEKLLQDKLKDFDSDFLKQNQSDDIIIDLIDAACKLEIDSLLDLLLDDVVDMITHKAPQDIEKIFTVRYNGDDRLFNKMKNLMDLEINHVGLKYFYRTSLN